MNILVLERFKMGFCIFSLGICATALILWITHSDGLVTSWDSAAYYQGAQSLNNGEGFMIYSKYGTLVPLTGHPPGYSMILSVGKSFGKDIPEWARIVNAALFGMNIALIALFGSYVTRRMVGGLVGGGLALFFSCLLENHVGATSEGLFIFFLIIWLWLMIAYVQSSRAGLLIAATMLASLACMTRYAGISVVLAGGMSIGFLTQKSQRQRMVAVVIYSVLSLAMPVVWVIRNFKVDGHPAGFTTGISLQALDSLIRGISAVYDYFLPFNMPLRFQSIVVLVVMVAGIIGIRRALQSRISAQNDTVMAGWRVTGLFCAAYLFTVVIAALISKGEVSLIARILLPLPVAVIMLMPTILVGRKRLEVLGISTFVLICFMGLMALRTGFKSVELYKSGVLSHEGSDFIKRLKAIPEKSFVYTDDMRRFYLDTGRAPVEIPSRLRDASYFLPLELARKRFLDQSAVVVIYKEKKFDPHEVWKNLVQLVDLKQTFSDGYSGIYVVQ